MKTFLVLGFLLFSALACSLQNQTAPSSSPDFVLDRVYHSVNSPISGQYALDWTNEKEVGQTKNGMYFICRPVGSDIACTHAVHAEFVYTKGDQNQIVVNSINLTFAQAFTDVSVETRGTVKYKATIQTEFNKESGDITVSAPVGESLPKVFVIQFGSNKSDMIGLLEDVIPPTQIPEPTLTLTPTVSFPSGAQ